MFFQFEKQNLKKYKSKIDFGIVLFIAIVIGSISAIMIANQIWPGLIINFVVCAFICYVFSSTYYTINGN